jgi:hypothetical protein
MSVIYTDTTNQYTVNDDIFSTLATTESWFQSFLSPVESSVNRGLGSIISGISNWQKNNTERYKSEYAYYLNADKTNNGNTNLIVPIAIIIVIYLIYKTNKK